MFNWYFILDWVSEGFYISFFCKMFSPLKLNDGSSVNITNNKRFSNAILHAAKEFGRVICFDMILKVYFK